MLGAAMFLRSFPSLRLFLQDRRASVVPMFALAIIPVIGLVGAAVDYSRANSIRSGVQGALDATALAMARLAPTLTETELKTQASAYFSALFSRPDAKNVDVNAVYTTTNGSTLTITATGKMDTTFTRVMGYTEINIGSSATIKWGNQRLRVALVLDTTGSMASAGKIDALKTATKNLLDQLKAAATTDGDVYVSIIPFSKDVNVGHFEPQRLVAAMGRRNRQVVGRGQRHLQQIGLFAAQRLSDSGHMFAVRQHHPEHLHRRRHVFAVQLHQPEHLHLGRHMLQPRADQREQLHLRAGLHELGLHTPETVRGSWRHLGIGNLDTGHLDGRRLDAFDLDAEEPQRELERLRDGSRQRDTARHDGGQRPESDHADHGRRDDLVLSGAIQQLLARNDGPELQLDGDEDRGERALSQWQHQPADRTGLGLAIAGRRRPADDADQGRQLRLQGSHHPAVGRPEHAGPLVRQRLRRVHLGRQPHVLCIGRRHRYLQEHQGHRDHRLYHPGEHRRRPRSRPC
jgi:Flp pilus assembly protein TadG